MPFLQGSLLNLLTAASLMGVLSAAAAGISYQLATQHADGESATVAVSLGFVSSAPLVLLVEMALGIGPRAPPHKLPALYGAMGALCLAAMAAAVTVVLRQHRHPRQQEYGGHLEAPLLLDEGSLVDEQVQITSVPDQDASLAGTYSAMHLLLTALWPAAAAVGINICVSQLLFPFFTHFRSSGALGDCMLPMVLFWCRAFSDIVGRLMPRSVLRGPPLASVVLALAILRLTLLPFPLLRIAGLLPPALQSDWLLAVYIAGQWLIGGAVHVSSFLLIPRLVNPRQAPHASSVLTLTFNACCLLGILLAIPVNSVIAR
jgi:hypothetical protein